MTFPEGLAYRMPIYLMFGVTTEVLFTGTCNLIAPDYLRSWNIFTWQRTHERPEWSHPARDPRAMGFTFLWMLPIYALLAGVEIIYPVIAHWPILLRGLFYVLSLWAVEFISGWSLNRILGRCPWDYGKSRWTFYGYIRLDFFPWWFGFTLSAEWLHLRLIALTPALKQVLTTSL